MTVLQNVHLREDVFGRRRGVVEEKLRGQTEQSKKLYALGYSDVFIIHVAGRRQMPSSARGHALLC